MGNRCKIIVHPTTIDVRPLRPEVRAGFEALYFLVVWDDSEDRWVSVTLDNFRDAHGEVATRQGQRVFLHSEGNTVKSVDFVAPVRADDHVRYDITYQGLRPGDVLAFNATVLLKPLEELAAQGPDVSKSMKAESSR
jgi:hypothetical protein